MQTPLTAPTARIQRVPVRYPGNAADVFTLLGGTTATDSVLLESADIESKEGLSSIAVLEASLRVTCTGNRVTVCAQSPSGQMLADRLAAQLAQYRDENDTCSFSFPQSTADDERERLMSMSPIQPLRLLQMDPGYTDDSGSLPFLAGGFAFDFLDTFEDLPSVTQGINTYPDYQFVTAEILFTIDHQEKTAELIGVSVGTDNRDPVHGELEARLVAYAEKIANHCEDNSHTFSYPHGHLPVKAETSDAVFRRQVEDMRSHIRAGDIYQVVPARTFTCDCPDAFNAYRTLRETNPSPYMFYVRGVTGSDGQPYELFGASPESNLKFTAATRQVELYPIAGTRPRGLNPDGSVNDELDIRAELQLRTDAKEIAEHTMLVDLARNDLARVAVPATRRVAGLLQVDRYSRVMHLVSRVTATLAADLDALDAYRACMNMGTLTGAPKLKAMELLRSVEGTRRGSYGGAVGYLRGGGDMDTCIVIRSAYVTGGLAAVQAGAGVVRDSHAQAEADETLHKAYAVLNAIAQAQGLSPEVHK